MANGGQRESAEKELNVSQMRQGPLPLYERILDPLIQVSGMSAEDAQVFKKELTKVIITEAILKALGALREEEKEKVVERLKKTLSDQEKLAILQEEIKDSPEAKKALQSYLEEELPRFIKELAITFVEKTTPEKRRKFLELLSQG